MEWYFLITSPKMYIHYKVLKNLCLRLHFVNFWKLPSLASAILQKHNFHKSCRSCGLLNIVVKIKLPKTVPIPSFPRTFGEFRRAFCMNVVTPNFSYKAPFLRHFRGKLTRFASKNAACQNLFSFRLNVSCSQSFTTIAWSDDGFTPSTQITCAYYIHIKCAA